MSALPRDQDWRYKKTLIECNRYMWDKEVACDVWFLVGRDEKKRVGAHKYVLASRSSVFYAMFFGPLSGNTRQEIEIIDMTPEMFKDLLEFIYTEDVSVDLNNVLATLYASRKYGVQSLIDKCLNRLKQNMIPENVCTMMENAHMFGDLNLKAKCFELILSEPERVFRADNLAELCQECFASVVKDDRVPVEEEVIFNAVLKYARDKCVLENLAETPENLREMVKDVIPHVRFPLMSNVFVGETVDPSGLLTEQQLLTLYRYFARSTHVAIPEFNCKKRKMVFTVQRFTDLGSGWGYKREKVDALKFSSSTDIILKGIQIYGSCQGPGNLDAMVELSQQHQVGKINIQNAHKLLETDGKQKIYNLFFDSAVPIRLRKDVKYTLTLVINGPSTYYGTKGLREVRRDDVTIIFEKSELSTNNTNEERGQIPGIIYELVPEPTEPEVMDIHA